MTMLRIFAAAAAAIAITGTALAADPARKPERHDWGFSGPFGMFDRAALQRGFQVYQEVCAACHGLRQLSFRHLGDDGGPFHDPAYPNPNDNPVVRYIAARYMIEDGPDDVGDMFEREGVPADRFPSPYPNDAAARASNGGALPPDLSVIVSARAGGADYIRSLLLGYDYDPPEGFSVEPPMRYNAYFPGERIMMANPLVEGMVTYADGTEASVEQMANDVTEFLAWASDPKLEQRRRIGGMTLIFLFVFAGLLWFSYKQVWRNVAH
ncbi:MAG: cytochrome c1 [Maricaulaceae bacterium]|nr:cytochrome c1 [Maricaulaceae bacterium]